VLGDLVLLGDAVNEADKNKILWPDIKTFWHMSYDKAIDYQELFGSITPPTLWQNITYYAWRKWWYAVIDWLRSKICGGC
jgi:hypothetical protein